MNPTHSRRRLLTAGGGLVAGVCGGVLTSSTPATAVGEGAVGPSAVDRPDPVVQLADEDRLEYTNPEFGYRIEYPERWEVDDESPTAVWFDDDELDVLGSVIVSEVDDDTTTADAVESHTDYYEVVFGGYEIIDEEAVRLASGQEAIVLDQRGELQVSFLRERAIPVDRESNETFVSTLLLVEDGLEYTVELFLAEDERAAETEAVLEEVVRSFSLEAGDT